MFFSAQADAIWAQASATVRITGLPRPFMWVGNNFLWCNIHHFFLKMGQKWPGFPLTCAAFKTLPIWCIFPKVHLNHQRNCLTFWKILLFSFFVDAYVFSKIKQRENWSRLINICCKSLKTKNTPKSSKTARA